MDDKDLIHISDLDVPTDQNGNADANDSSTGNADLQTPYDDLRYFRNFDIDFAEPFREQEEEFSIGERVESQTEEAEEKEEPEEQPNEETPVEEPEEEDTPSWIKGRWAASFKERGANGSFYNAALASRQPAEEDISDLPLEYINQEGETQKKRRHRQDDELVDTQRKDDTPDTSKKAYTYNNTHGGTHLSHSALGDRGGIDIGLRNGRVVKQAKKKTYRLTQTGQAGVEYGAGSMSGIDGATNGSLPGGSTAVGSMSTAAYAATKEAAARKEERDRKLAAKQKNALDRLHERQRLMHQNSVGLQRLVNGFGVTAASHTALQGSYAINHRAEQSAAAQNLVQGLGHGGISAKGPHSNRTGDIGEPANAKKSIGLGHLAPTSISERYVEEIINRRRREVRLPKSAKANRLGRSQSTWQSQSSVSGVSGRGNSRRESFANREAQARQDALLRSGHISLGNVNSASNLDDKHLSTEGDMSFNAMQDRLLQSQMQHISVGAAHLLSGLTVVPGAGALGGSKVAIGHATSGSTTSAASSASSAQAAGSQAAGTPTGSASASNSRAEKENAKRQSQREYNQEKSLSGFRRGMLAAVTTVMIGCAGVGGVSSVLNNINNFNYRPKIAVSSMLSEPNKKEDGDSIASAAYAVMRSRLEAIKSAVLYGTSGDPSATTIYSDLHERDYTGSYWEGPKYEVTTAQLKQITKVCIADQGESKMGVMWEASVMLNVLEQSSKYSHDAEGILDMIGSTGAKMFRKRQYAAARTKVLEQTECDMELAAAVKEVLDGKRVLPNYVTKIVQSSDLAEGTNNIVEKSMRGKYTRMDEVDTGGKDTVYFYGYPDGIFGNGDLFGYTDKSVKKAIKNGYKDDVTRAYEEESASIPGSGDSEEDPYDQYGKMKESDANKKEYTMSGSTQMQMSDVRSANGLSAYDIVAEADKLRESNVKAKTQSDFISKLLFSLGKTHNVEQLQTQPQGKIKTKAMGRYLTSAGWTELNADADSIRPGSIILAGNVKDVLQSVSGGADAIVQAGFDVGEYMENQTGWYYTNHGQKAGSPEKAVNKNNYAMNCCHGVVWVLRKALGNSKVREVWGYEGALHNENSGNGYVGVTDLGFSIIDYDPGQLTVQQAIDNGTLKAGDIVTYWDLGHTNLYLGNGQWFDSGTAYGKHNTGGHNEMSPLDQFIGETHYGVNQIAHIIRLTGHSYSYRPQRTIKIRKEDNVGVDGVSAFVVKDFDPATWKMEIYCKSKNKPLLRTVNWRFKMDNFLVYNLSGGTYQASKNLPDILTLKATYHPVKGEAKSLSGSSNKGEIQKLETSGVLNFEKKHKYTGTVYMPVETEVCVQEEETEMQDTEITVEHTEDVNGVPVVSSYTTTEKRPVVVQEAKYETMTTMEEAGTDSKEIKMEVKDPIVNLKFLAKQPDGKHTSSYQLSESDFVNYNEDSFFRALMSVFVAGESNGDALGIAEMTNGKPRIKDGDVVYKRGKVFTEKDYKKQGVKKSKKKLAEESTESESESESETERQPKSYEQDEAYKEYIQFTNKIKQEYLEYACDLVDAAVTRSLYDWDEEKDGWYHDRTNLKKDKKVNRKRMGFYTVSYEQVKDEGATTTWTVDRTNDKGETVTCNVYCQESYYIVPTVTIYVNCDIERIFANTVYSNGSDWTDTQKTLAYQYYWQNGRTFWEQFDLRTTVFPIQKDNDDEYGDGGALPYYAKIIYKYFHALGFSDFSIAGILGNVVAECGGTLEGINPAAIEGGHEGAAKGNGHGIIQWSYERWPRLRAFAEQRGKSWSDINVQLDFLWHEMSTDYAKYTALLREAKSPDEACTIFFWSFELGCSSEAEAHSKHPDPKWQTDFSYNSVRLPESRRAYQLMHVKGEKNGKTSDVVAYAEELHRKGITYSMGYSYGYETERMSSSNPNGVTSTDCSGFVYMTLVESGNLPDHGTYAFDTTNMGAVLTRPANGYVQLPFTSVDQLQAGDVLVYDYGGGKYGHTMIARGDGFFIDVNGTKQAFFTSSHGPWQWVYRKMK